MERHMTAANGNIQQAVLPNGLVVITEPMEHVHSVSVGIWLRSGSRREPANLNGISHFIQHMVFKGTTRRSAEDIAREVDSVGGMLDAFTSKEMVCFNTRVLDEHLAKVFDVIADMVHELFTQNFWYPHALGKPILGTPETVGAFSRDTLRSWFHERYSPNNMVITAAGHLTHAQLLDLVAARFADRPAGNPLTSETTPVAAPHITVRTKHELEQVHLCLGVSALPMTDRRRFAVSVLSNVLGGGMSSRLFQNIRERQGLAYAIFSEMNSYRDAGVLSVYAGTSLETVSQLVRSVLEEFRRMKDEPLPEEEL